MKEVPAEVSVECLGDLEVAVTRAAEPVGETVFDGQLAGNGRRTTVASIKLGVGAFEIEVENRKRLSKRATQRRREFGLGVPVSLRLRVAPKGAVTGYGWGGSGAGSGDVGCGVSGTAGFSTGSGVSLGRS